MSMLCVRLEEASSMGKDRTQPSPDFELSALPPSVLAFKTQK